MMCVITTVCVSSWIPLLALSPPGCTLGRSLVQYLSSDWLVRLYLIWFILCWVGFSYAIAPTIYYYNHCIGFQSTIKSTTKLQHLLQGAFISPACLPAQYATQLYSLWSVVVLECWLVTEADYNYDEWTCLLHCSDQDLEWFAINCSFGDFTETVY